MLEVRWRAVDEYRVAQARGEMTHELADQIASKHGLGTGRNLRHLVQKVIRGENLTRKSGSGRPRQRDYAAVNQFMMEVAAQHNYAVTYSFLLRRVKGEFGYGSSWLLQRIMQEYNWTKVCFTSMPQPTSSPNFQLLVVILRGILQTKQRAVPRLTAAHQRERLAWCKARETPSLLYGAGTSTVHVHIDEKCFYAFKTGKTLYMPHDVEPPAQEIQSKTKIPSVMFLAAVGFPRYGC